MSRRRTVVDLFCGAGGLSAGLEMAGFDVLAGNDLFASAGKTFEATHPHAKFFGEPIQELKAAQLLEDIGLKRGRTVCIGRRASLPSLLCIQPSTRYARRAIATFQTVSSDRRRT